MTKPESSLGIEGAVSVAETASSASPALPMGEGQAGGGDPSAVGDDTPWEPGSVLWHSSEEDGGPDVGIEIGLGLGLRLYCGEISTETLEEHGIDLETYPDGWWLVLYGPEDTWIIGAVPENYRAQEAVEHIGWAISEAAKPASPSKAPPIVAAGEPDAAIQQRIPPNPTLKQRRGER